MKERSTPNPFWSAAALVVFITFLTYGVLIPQLGFYRDDWYMLLIGRGRGSEGLIAIFQTDRPFVGYLYAVYFRLFGMNPLGWHLTALLFRAFGAVSFLWLLRMLFPRHWTYSVWAAALYAVYPGFLQQPIAATYLHLILAVSVSIFSLALTVYAFSVEDRRRRAFSILIASLLTVFYLFIFETMIGVEAARLCIVVYLLARSKSFDWKTAARKTVLWMLPFFLAAGGFLVWRVFFFKAERHSTDLDALLAQYSVSPLRSALTILVETGKDFIEMVFLSWSVPFYQFVSRGNIADLAASVGLAAAVLGGVYLYLRRYGKDDETAPDFPVAGVWLGALISLLTLFPLNLAGRNILFSSHWDRYTIHAALGGIFIVASLIYTVLRPRARRPLLFTLLAIGVITQYHSAADYRNFWKQQREAWWQIAWRAPNFEDHTLLFLRLKHGYGFFEDYEIYGPANLIYTTDEKIRIAADLINARSIPLLIRQEVKGKRIRGIFFRRDYRNALIFTYPTAASCLHAVDGRQVEAPDFAQEDVLYISEYSKIDRIAIFADPVSPPQELFGPPPPQDWCYYYQKISLARQQGDWQEAARLAAEAERLGFKPRDPSEWIPVFEAYANTGQFDFANQIAQQMTRSEDMTLLFCTQIKNRTDFDSAYNLEYISSALCPP